MSQSSAVPLLSKSPLQFDIISQCSKSRCRYAKLKLPHHVLETPTFMPVGTQGTVKGLLPHQVEAAGADIILGNTYHLGTRPGKEVLTAAGGLHKWMSWNRGLLTDSGGFQMVSLLKLAKITEQGVTFQSPYDGSECVLTPEESIAIQNSIGADIMMQLDDVVDVRETDYERFKEAVHRTTRWLDRCITANKNTDTQNLFPIVQGGLFKDLRELSCEQLIARDAPGYAIGGLSGGEEKYKFWPTVEQCTGLLPVNKPRYCMGVGFAPDLVVCTALGVDMFDCVYPTRTARFGCALVNTGQINLKQEKYSEDFSSIDDECDCTTCKSYTKAYLNALFRSKAPVACSILSIHNIAYQMKLMKSIRESVRDGRFPQFTKDFMKTFYGSNDIPKWILDALASVNIDVLEKTETDDKNRLVPSDDSRSHGHEQDSDGDDDCHNIKDFETLTYNRGYRQALLSEYPQVEKEAWVKGYVDAFKSTQEKLLMRESDAAENRTVHSSATSNEIFELSSLESSLSLLLWKYQEKMSTEQLREIVSVQKKISELLLKQSVPEESCIVSSLDNAKEQWYKDIMVQYKTYKDPSSAEGLKIIDDKLKEFNISARPGEVSTSNEACSNSCSSFCNKNSTSCKNMNKDILQELREKAIDIANKFQFTIPSKSSFFIIQE